MFSQVIHRGTQTKNVPKIILWADGLPDRNKNRVWGQGNKREQEVSCAGREGTCGLGCPPALCKGCKRILKGGCWLRKPNWGAP